MSFFVSEDNLTNKNLRSIIMSLSNGEAVFCPSGTIPGLSCLVSMSDILAELKGRRLDQKFLSIYFSRRVSQKTVFFPSVSLEFGESLSSFFPNYSTLILPSVCGDGSISLRLPLLGTVRILLIFLAMPLCSTSANFHTEKPARSYKSLPFSIRRKMSWILDNFLESAKPSDIVSFLSAKRVYIRKNS